jgi:membrane protein YdbS with pleckstrin-like domain
MFCVMFVLRIVSYIVKRGQEWVSCAYAISVVLTCKCRRVAAYHSMYKGWRYADSEDEDEEYEVRVYVRILLLCMCLSA